MSVYGFPLLFYLSLLNHNEFCCDFITEHKQEYGVSRLCRVLGVARSTYYKAITHILSKDEEKKNHLMKRIYTLWLECFKRYGAQKIWQELDALGEKISVRTVQRYMKQMGIQSITVKKHRPQSSGKPVEGKENLLLQDFSTTTIHEKWCTDITYIHTKKDGWTYLASVLDLHSKKIVGYSYGKNMTVELAKRAVEIACENTRLPTNLILHSDLGSQYTSEEFTNYVHSKGLRHSFSAKGNPYDNAPIESFHSILKREEVNHVTYYDFEEAQQAIFIFIVAWYNRKRIHSAINYQTPEQAHQNAS